MEPKSCIVCGKQLNGAQKKYCSNTCKQKDFYKTHKSNSAFKQFIRSAKRKLELIELKGGKCERCGYSKNMAALEFHHIKSEEKEHPMDSRFLANSSMETILEEADKCILLCANCHREVHNESHELNNVRELVRRNDFLLHTKKPEKYCIDCGKKLLLENKSGYCSTCIQSHKQKVERPTMEELSALLAENSLNAVGKLYGVSHAAIKKWAKKYGIL